MSGLATLRELFNHNDWARDKLLALAADLSDEALDRPFDMGPGSLRATLFHLWACEFGWLRRWQPGSDHGYADEPAGESIDEMRRRFIETAAERDAFMAGLTEADGGRRITYQRRDGGTSTFPLGDMMLHVTNHGVHHRAQVLNMLRHLGVEKLPGLDYLFMRGERPTLKHNAETIAAWRGRGFDVSDTPEPPVEFDADTLREYYRYSDWATQRVVSLAAELSDDELDQVFQMGVGTLRKTLTHLRDGEEWWCNNWTGSPQPFEKLPPTTSIPDLIKSIRGTIEWRDAIFGDQSDDSLQHSVTIEPSRGVTMKYRMGETMLQLPAHGTHHRSQALNMLRRLGVALKEMDYLDWYDETNRAESEYASEQESE